MMTSQPGQQRIPIHILLNIFQIKGNQTMNFGQLIEYNERKIFLQKSCKKGGRETSSRLLFVFSEKRYYKAKVDGLQLGFTIFR